MIQSVVLLTPVYVCAFWTLVFLMARPSSNHARFFLGYFMLGVFLIHLGLVFHLREDYETFYRFEPVYNMAIFMIFPMYYFYIRLLTVDVIPRYRYLYHYIPALIIIVLTFLSRPDNQPFLSGNGPESLTLGERFIKASFNQQDWLDVAFNLAKKILLVFQIVLYTYKSAHLFRRHHQRILNFYSTESTGNIKWVKISFFILLVFSFAAIVYAFFGKNKLHFNMDYLFITSFVSSFTEFIIGYLGNRQVQVVKELEEEITESIPESDNKIIRDDTELKQKIEWAFAEKKLHRNPELSIWDVSGELNTNRTYVSNFINRYYGVNFSRFVNKYRVEEAKQMLLEPQFRKFSLETIGEKCGFGSLNNFIRVFQSIEDITPGNFRKSQSAKNAPVNPGHP